MWIMSRLNQVSQILVKVVVSLHLETLLFWAKFWTCLTFVMLEQIGVVSANDWQTAAQLKWSTICEDYKLEKFGLLKVSAFCHHRLHHYFNNISLNGWIKFQRTLTDLAIIHRRCRQVYVTLHNKTLTAFLKLCEHPWHRVSPKNLDCLGFAQTAAIKRFVPVGLNWS